MIRNCEKIRKMKTHHEPIQSLRSSRERLPALILLVSYLTGILGPGGVALANPDVYFRPNAGITRLPLDVASFDAPGFGDVSDAVNLATGSLYLGTDALSNNSVIGSTDHDSKDRQGLFSGNWSLNNKMRLYGFRKDLLQRTSDPISSWPQQAITTPSNLITNQDVTTSYWPGYFKKPAITNLGPSYFTLEFADSGVTGAEKYSGVYLPGALGPGQYQVSFTGRTLSGTLPIQYGLDDPLQASATLTTTWQTFTTSFMVNNTTNRTFQIFENVAGNPNWQIGDISVRQQVIVVGGNGPVGATNLATPQDLTSATWQGYWAKPYTSPGLNAYRINGENNTAQGIPPANTGILHEEPNRSFGKFRVSFEARAPSNTTIQYGLDDLYMANAAVTPQWQTFTTDFDVVSGTPYTRRTFQAFKTQTDLPSWDVRNFSVQQLTKRIEPAATAPNTLSIGVGDGTTLNFTKTTTDTGHRPSWIQQYVSSSDPVAYYTLDATPGRQYQQDWVVLVSRTDPTDATKSITVAHYYDAHGNRTTFKDDGEYPSYSQNPHQQYRGNTAGDPDGVATTYRTTYGYDGLNTGRLARVQDEWGRSTQYDYDTITHLLTHIGYLRQGTTYTREVTFTYASGLLTDLTYIAGGSSRATHFAYSGTHIQSIRRPGPNGNLTTSYTYYPDGNQNAGRIWTVAEPGVTAITYAYNGTTVTETQGTKTQTYTYDASGVLRGRNDNGQNYDFIYDPNGSIGRITFPTGKVATYGYDDRGNTTLLQVAGGTDPTTGGPITQTVTTQYDNNNNPSVLTTTGAAVRKDVFTNSYYGAGAISQVKDTMTAGAYTTINTKTFDTAGRQSLESDSWGTSSHTVTYAYGGSPAAPYADFPTRITDTASGGAPSITRDLTYNALGNALTDVQAARSVTRTFNGFGELLTERLAGGGADRTESWTRNADGSVATHTLGGRVTTSTYDGNGFLTNVSDPTHSVSYDRYDGFGRLTQQTEDGVVTKFTAYDRWDRVAGKTITADDGGVRTLSYGYDAGGVLLSQSETYGNGNAGSYTNTINNEVDSLGRITKTIMNTGTSASYTIKTVYDADDHPTKITDSRYTGSDGVEHPEVLTYDALGNMLTDTQGSGSAHTYTNDAHGNVLSDTLTDAGTSKSSFDGRDQVYSHTDARGDVTTYLHDALGNVISERRPYGVSLVSTYDALSRQLTSNDPKGNAITHTYDAFGSMLTETLAGVTLLRHTYNAAGQLIQVEEPNQNGVLVITQQFGAFENNRPTAIAKINKDSLVNYTYGYTPNGKIQSIASGADYSVSNAYDGHGNLVSTTTSNTGGTNYSETNRYDRYDNPVDKTTPISTVHNDYDLRNNIISKTENDVTTTYTYDLQDKLLSENGAGVHKIYTNYLSGWRSSEKLGNGTITTYTYDGVGDVLTEHVDNHHTNTYTYNAQHLRTRRDFEGIPAVYAQQRDATGKFINLSTTGNLVKYSTFWFFDSNGNLTETYDQPTGTTLQQNHYTYSNFTILNKPKSITWDVQAKVQPLVMTNDLYTVFGGKNGVLAGATTGTATVTYTNSDRGADIASVNLTEQVPEPYPPTTTDNPKLNYNRLGRNVSNTLTYSYFNSMQRKSVTNAPNSGTARTVNYDYDSQGRVTQEGAVLTSYSGNTVTKTKGLRNASDFAERVMVNGRETSSTIGYNVTGTHYNASGLVDLITTSLTYRTGSTTTTFAYDAEGRLSQKTQSGSTATFVLDPNGSGSVRQINVSNGPSVIYTLDALGNRLGVAGNTTSGAVGLISTDNFDGYQKRYDADLRPAEFAKVGDSVLKDGKWYWNSRYALYRYDPLGNQVLTAQTTIAEYGPNNLSSPDPYPYQIHSVGESLTTAVFVGNDAQMMRSETAYGRQTMTPVVEQDPRIEAGGSDGPQNLRDQTYTLADTVGDTVNWGGVMPFDTTKATPRQPGEAVPELSAPTPSVSQQFGLQPVNIQPPTIGSVPLTGGTAPAATPNAGMGVVPNVTGFSAVLPPSGVVPPSAPVVGSDGPNGVLAPNTNVVPTTTGGAPLAAGAGPAGVVPQVGAVTAPLAPGAPTTGGTGAQDGSFGVPLPPEATAVVPGIVNGGVVPTLPDGPHGGNAPVTLVTLDDPENRMENRAANLDEVAQKVKSLNDDSLSDAQRQVILDSALRLLGNYIGGQNSVASAQLFIDSVSNLPAADRTLLKIRMVEGIMADEISANDLHNLAYDASKLKSTNLSSEARYQLINYDIAINVQIEATANGVGTFLGLRDAIEATTGQTGGNFSQPISLKSRLVSGGLVLLGFVPGERVVAGGAKLASSIVRFGRLFEKAIDGLEALAKRASKAREAGHPNCLNSFEASTLVRTATGAVAIGALTVGANVLAFNEDTGKNEVEPVLQVLKHEDGALTLLSLVDPASRQSETLTTTPEHPFYITERSDTEARPKPVGHEDLNEHWVGAGHLKVGDKIRKADGTTGVVKYVNTVSETRTMYNLEVAEAHTFFVGTGGWLVHNCANKAEETAARTYTQPGWIKKDLYSELTDLVDSGRLSPDVLKKFEESLKGFASGKGSTGIKPLGGSGVKIGGFTYQYELKVLGQGGGARLYGNMNERGQVIFERFARDH